MPFLSPWCTPRRHSKALRLPTALFCLIFCLITHPIFAVPTADFDSDGQIGFTDFLLFVQHFGAHQNDALYSAAFDLDGSGDIGFADFIAFAAQFGKPVAQTSSIAAYINATDGGDASLPNGPAIHFPPGAISQSDSIRIARITLPDSLLPQNAQRIGEIYDIQLDSATVIAPIDLALPYAASALPAGAATADLFAVWWDGETWHTVSGTVDSQFVHIRVDHLSRWTELYTHLPAVRTLTAQPDSVLLVPGDSTAIALRLEVDPAGIRTTDLRVRLTASLSDSVSFTTLGKITLTDIGLPDPELTETVAGLTMHSVDPTEALDGIYGAAFAFNADAFPAQFSVLKLDITLTTRRIASVAVDTTLIVPIVRAPTTVHAISGRLLRTGKGVDSATVVLSGPVVTTTTTDAEGRYSFTKLADGAYVVTPFKPGYAFTPASRTVTLSGADVGSVDFVDITDGASYAGGPALTLDENGYFAVDVASGNALSQATDSLTVEAWVRSVDTQQRVIAGRWQGDNATPAGQWLLTTRSVSISDGATAFTALFDRKIQPDTWTHYAIAVKHNRLRVYINGRLERDDTTNVAGLYTGAFPDDQLVVGAYQNGQGKTPLPFNGQIDEVRIWNRALSADEIRANMHRSMKPVFSRPVVPKQAIGPDLVGYWNFDTLNRDGTVPDLSGQSASGALAGTAARTDGNAPLALPVGNPILQATPLALDMAGAVETRDIALENVGSGQLIWTIDETVNWLYVSSKLGHTGGSGSFFGSGPLALTAQATGIGLPTGPYETTLHVWSNGGLIDIPVTFDNQALANSITIDTLVTPAGTLHQMIAVPAGEFTMGSAAGGIDAGPPHAVYLDAYRIDRFEVTNAQYTAFVEATTRLPAGFYNDPIYNGPAQPVVGVSWSDADAYCTWIGGRLPTEAEWEKAARGPAGRTYPWGETTPDSTLLNFDHRIGKTVSVGSYPQGASPYGVCDMAGNVWEWTRDWYGGTYYTDSPDVNPQGPEHGTLRVARGGSWAESAAYVRADYRYEFAPATSNELLGFRCVAPP